MEPVISKHYILKAGQFDVRLSLCFEYGFSYIDLLLFSSVPYKSSQLLQLIIILDLFPGIRPDNLQVAIFY